MELARGYLDSVETNYLSLFELDKNVFRIQRDDDPDLVIRIFGDEEECRTARRTRDILEFVARNNISAERLAPGFDTAIFKGYGIVVTNFIVGPKVTATKENCIRLGAWLGKLNSLPYDATGYPGGAWHIITGKGGMVAELKAAKACLRGRAGPDNKDTIAELCANLDGLNCFENLPHVLIHADCVPSNAILDEDMIRLIDWANAGYGPRVWALGFLLYAVSMRTPRLALAVMGGYKRFIQLTESELDVLENAMLARPLVIACWEARHRNKPIQEVFREYQHLQKAVHEIAELVRSSLRSNK